MGEPTRIVIIGGSACGPKAAARAKRCDPEAKVTLLEKSDYVSTATCGFPYFVSGVVYKESALVVRKPDYFKRVMDIDVLTGMEALSVDRKAHVVQAINLKTKVRQVFGYDRLVIATGASLKAIPLLGINLKGIFNLNQIQDAFDIRNAVSRLNVKKAVVIGAGLIGLEVAENFVFAGIDVTVVETLGYPLPTLLDPEIGKYLEAHLAEKRVKMFFGERVTGFEGDTGGNVKRVLVGNKALDAELVLLAIGTAPNVKLAEEAGLIIGELRAIAVNEYLQTSDQDIYAGGDCVENVNLVTGKKTLSPLGSTANKHGRVIGTNVTGGNDTFPGVVGTAIAKVFDFNVARTGLNEYQAKKEGIEFVTSLVPGDEHATYYPGAKEFIVKLIAERATGRVLGGQVVGKGDTTKRIDALATALAFGVTADKLANIDLAYAPPYNSAIDPLHHAANVIRNKMSGLAEGITPEEVKKMIDRGDDFIFLDVRDPDEWKECRIEAKQVVYLALPDLRSKMNTLPKDKKIITFCRRSVRAYQALRTLKGAGFKDVSFMDGSITAWGYGLCTNPEPIKYAWKY